MTKGVFIGVLWFFQSTLAAAGTDPESSDLASGFISPPDTSRPHVWWHWINGNVSKEGITADLEAMKRAGIGAAWIFNLGQQIPEGPAGFLSPIWMEMLDHAVHESDRLGLQLGIQNCDGWSQSGGPWIKPENSMKRLTWSETRVCGPERIAIRLPAPPAALAFYREVAVLAVPAPSGGRIGKPSSVHASFGPFDAEQLQDGNVDSVALIPAAPDEEANWIEFIYPQPVSVRALSLTTPLPKPKAGDVPRTTARLEAMGEDRKWRTVAEFNILWSMVESPVPGTTVAFDEVRADRFRLSFFGVPEFELAEVEFTAVPYVHYWQLKGGWNRVREHGGEFHALSARGGPVHQRDDPTGLPLAQVVRLDRLMQADGSLHWDVPAGEWLVYRVGLTTTGRRNAPASRQGEGLECDKLSRSGIEAHFPNYVRLLADRYGPPTGHSLRLVLTDSWEAGMQNWTEKLPAEFRVRRGYDLEPWLPLLLTGRVIESPALSERVLWDFRRTLADLIKDNYYNAFRELSHQAGLTYYGEGSGKQQYMYDPLNYQSTHDVPMGEFWVQEGMRVDNRVAASVAHTYGRSVVGAEAYTGRSEVTRWTNDPFSLKAEGDLAFCAGVNAFVLHRYAHQPWMHVAPGMTMSKWGTMLERTVTWWEFSRPWFDYLSRCQHLLRQGLFVADVCYFIGEDVPNLLPERSKLSIPPPSGIDYDGCNEEVLCRFVVRDGRLVLPHGQSYAVMVLPATRTMRPTSLRVIHDLVRAGATVVGRRPIRSPSFADRGAGDAELGRLAGELWGPWPATASLGTAVAERDRGLSVRTVGLGRVIEGEGATWAKIATLLNLRPDFEVAASDQASVHYIHRQQGGRNFYFVATDSKKPIATVARFRVTGKRPQLWDPQTGERRSLPEFNDDGEMTSIPLQFDPSGSYFVVFATDSTVGVAGSRTRNFPKWRTIAETEGAWQVAFDPAWGGPASVAFPRLIDWSSHADDAIRYYSGAATYRKTLALSRIPNTRVWLNLGDVKNLAEVRLNGRTAGIVWKPPFRIEITEALRRGDNELEVRVVNLWANRLIGDERLPADVEWRRDRPVAWPAWLTDATQPRTSGRLTFAAYQHFTRTDPLLASGLLGPVILEEALP